MEPNMLNAFYSFISRPQAPTFINYDHPVQPLTYDFMTNNESTGPSFPALNAPHLYQTHVPGSSYYQDTVPLTNLPQFCTQQGQVGAPPFKFSADGLHHSWQPESPIIKSRESSISVSSFNSTEPSTTINHGQAFLNPDLPTDPGPQPCSHYREKCFQTPISAITTLLLPDTAPEAGPSSSWSTSRPSMPVYTTLTGKMPTTQRSKLTRFTPFGDRRRGSPFHGQQDQDGACSFYFPTGNHSPPLGSSGISSLIPCRINTDRAVSRQTSAVLDFPADYDDNDSQASSISLPNERPLKLIQYSITTTPASPPTPGSTPKITISKRKTTKPPPPPIRQPASNADQLKSHGLQGIAIEKTNLKCTVGQCSETCPSITEYRKHLKTVHKVCNSHTSGETIDCPVSGCIKKLKEGSVMRHILTHSDAVRFGCRAAPDDCFKTFTRIDSLKSHINSSHSNLWRQV